MCICKWFLQDAPCHARSQLAPFAYHEKPKTSCWGLVGTVFNYFIKRRFSGWWTRYNYITSAALDCGLVVATVVIFFALHMTQAAIMVWFGNAEALGTLDMTSRAIKSSLPRGGIFGPETWS